MLYMKKMSHRKSTQVPQLVSGGNKLKIKPNKDFSEAKKKKKEKNLIEYKSFLLK